MNKRLINQCKAMYKQIEQTTPNVYAGIAIALHRRYGWGFKRINDIFNDSQLIWDECVKNNVDMTEMCLDETGIDVRAGRSRSDTGADKGSC
jgi:hypothetical protein